MADCIEREAVIDRLKRNLGACNPGSFSELCYRDAIETVKRSPAADVAPVVRCKDCKYRIYKDMGEEIGEIGGCALFNCAMTNDDFCSYGEKKDGGDA